MRKLWLLMILIPSLFLTACQNSTQMNTIDSPQLQNPEAPATDVTQQPQQPPPAATDPDAKPVTNGVNVRYSIGQFQAVQGQHFSGRISVTANSQTVSGEQVSGRISLGNLGYQ